MTRPRAARRGTPASAALIWLKTEATLSPGARSEGALAAVLGEARRIVDAGFFPRGGGLGIGGGRAMRDRALEPARERDDGFERDARDRPVGRRGDLEPRQLGFIPHEGCLF